MNLKLTRCLSQHSLYLVPQPSLSPHHTQTAAALLASFPVSLFGLSDVFNFTLIASLDQILRTCAGMTREHYKPCLQFSLVSNFKAQEGQPFHKTPYISIEQMHYVRGRGLCSHSFPNSAPAGIVAYQCSPGHLLMASCSFGKLYNTPLQCLFCDAIPRPRHPPKNCSTAKLELHNATSFQIKYEQQYLYRPCSNSLQECSYVTVLVVWWYRCLAFCDY